MMMRAIWSLAALSMAFQCIISAGEGPTRFFGWVDPFAWSLVMIAGVPGWLWLTYSAARGKFE